MTEAKRHKNPILTDVDRLRIKPFAPRLHPHIPPATDVCDAPTVCLTVNTEWASHILGALSVLEQLDAWQGTDQEVFDAIQKVRQIMDMLSCGCDNGNALVLYLQQIRVQQQLITNIYNVNHLLTDIDINAPDTNFDSGQSDSEGDSVFRDHALCLACFTFIEVVAQQIIAHNDQSLDLIGILTSPLAYFGPWAAFAVFLTNAGLRIINEVGLNGLKDQDAKIHFACCMADYLAGKANTFEVWSSFIDNCYTEGSSLENDINQCLRTAISITQENWLMFNKALAQQFRFAKAGIADDCVCGCDIPLHITAGVASLTSLDNCQYQFTLSAAPQIIDIERISGGCFTVTDWSWTNPTWVAQGVLCGESEIIEPNTWVGASWEKLHVVAYADFPITITFTVTE